MALKKQHKARWNCNMGKYQPGRGTWPTPQNGKWPYLKFRLGTYIPRPPTHPYLSNTPTNLCMALFNFVIVFFVLYSYTFVHNFHDNTMPCINLSEYWTTLSPSKSRPLKSWGQSHGLTMKHKNLTVNRFTGRWNTLFEYFHFCLEKFIFIHQLCRNWQISGIFISIRHIRSSCGQDKC